MIHFILSLQNSLVCTITFLIVVLATESVLLIAILKKKRVKAAGWFHKFGFEIEASDPPDRDKK